MLLRPALPGVKPTLCTRWRGVASAAPADGASGGSRCAQHNTGDIVHSRKGQILSTVYCGL